MRKRFLRLNLDEVKVGDLLYSKFVIGKEKERSGYLPVTQHRDMGSAGTFLAVEFDSNIDPLWIKVEKDKKACIVREQ